MLKWITSYFYKQITVISYFLLLIQWFCWSSVLWFVMKPILVLVICFFSDRSVFILIIIYTPPHSMKYCYERLALWLVVNISNISQFDLIVCFYPNHHFYPTFFLDQIMFLFITVSWCCIWLDTLIFTRISFPFELHWVLSASWFQNMSNRSSTAFIVSTNGNPIACYVSNGCDSWNVLILFDS